MPRTAEIKIVSFYNVPGEGLIVAIRADDKSLLYSKPGLQYRILERKKNGFDTTVEEQALTQMNNMLLPQSL